MTRWHLTLAVYVLALAAAVGYGVRTVDAQSSGRGLRLAGAGALLDAPRRVPVPHTGTSRLEHSAAWYRLMARGLAGQRRELRRANRVLRVRLSVSVRRVRVLRRVRVSERYGARYAIHLAAVTWQQPEGDLLRVAECESPGLQTDLVNLEPIYNGEHATGLMQFIPSTWASTPYAGEDIFDPVANALAAGWMWSHGRRGEWACR